LVATITRHTSGTFKLETTDKIKGIRYADGKEGMDNFDILFTMPQAVGDKEYSWNSATGIVTYDGQIVPVSGQTILNIPVGHPIGRMYFLKDDGETPFANHIQEKCSFYEYYL
jgi:hypothetical protein